MKSPPGRVDPPHTVGQISGESGSPEGAASQDETAQILVRSDAF